MGRLGAELDEGRVVWRRALVPLGLGVLWPTESFAYRRTGRSTLTTIRTAWVAGLLGLTELVVFLAFGLRGAGERGTHETLWAWVVVTAVSALAVPVSYRWFLRWNRRRWEETLPQVRDPEEVDATVAAITLALFSMRGIANILPIPVSCMGGLLTATYSRPLLAFGCALAIALVLVIAPTDRAIVRWQDRLVPPTVPVDLVRALRRVVIEGGP